MAAYTPSSSPPRIQSPPSHTTSTKRQHDSITLTARKVDLELLRLKGLGKVTKNSDTEDRKKSTTTTDTLQHSITNDNLDQVDGMNESDIIQHDSEQLQQLENYRQQLETSQLRIRTLKEELNTQHQQQEQQLQQEMVKYQTQLVEQEKLAHDTIANYMEKIESSQVNVRKLTLLVEKQDQLIELLMDDHYRQQPQNHNRNDGTQSLENGMTADWHSLYLEKQQLDTAIGSLKANMETNQAHMQMMMMVSTEIQNDFEQQKVSMEKKLSEMADELAAKDILLQHYQQQQKQHTPASGLLSSPQPPPPTSTLTKSSASYRPIVNDAVILNSDISPYPSLVSSSSSSRSSSSTSSRPSFSYSTSSSPPPLHLSTSSSIASAPSSPPPSIPLPPIPSQMSPAPSTTTSTRQQRPHHQYTHYQNQHGSPPMASMDTISFGGPVKKGSPIPQQPGTGSLDETTHHGKPFWKSMKTKWRNS